MDERSKVTYTLLDGKKVCTKKLDILKANVSKLNKQLGLAIIKIGNDIASSIYVEKKKKQAQALGYYCKVMSLDENIVEDKVIGIIKKLNEDNRIDGIIIELPLPRHLDRERIINSIDWSKDIDGLTLINRMNLENNKPYLVPCTPLAILDLLEYYQINLEGMEITIIGKSILVGTPLYKIFKNRCLKVNLLDSKTKNIEKYTTISDIIIIAIGKKHFLKGNMIRKGAIIIDVGINSLNGKIYGDVDFNDVKEKCLCITPVPGGIGPMTIYEAMNNVYKAYILKRKER